MVRTWRAAVAVLMLTSAGPAAAQGLVWNLPEDGTEVVYGGTVTQTDVRPGGEEVEMTWDNRLVVRSVGTQDVRLRDETVPGRWVEFEVTTGKATERGIDGGPVGTRIYKVLVAEPAVTGRADDERGIPVSFLPIVEGYVKVADRPPQKLESTAFEVFPTLSLLMNYKPNELTAEGEGRAVETPAGRFEATSYAAKSTVESPSTRVENTATLLVSPDMAFGPVRWTATAVRSTKDPNQPRDAFTEATRVTSEMEAKEINGNARSALNVTGG